MKHKFVSTTLLLSLIIFAATIQSSYAVEWSPDMRLTWGNTFNFSPSITQSDDGTVWVVWHSYRTHNYDIFYKTYNESLVHPWSPDTQLTSNLNYDLSPSITQAADGKLWVVWSSNRTGDYDIWYKYSSDNGTTWSPDTRLIEYWNPDLSPSITQAADGKLWVVWSSYRLGNYELYYKFSSDNGTTWSFEDPITTDWDDDEQPSIAGMSDGKMWVVWMRNGDLFYDVYTGSYWVGEEQLIDTPYPIVDSNPSITQLSNGEIWVVWDSYNVSAVPPEPNADTDLYYKNSSDKGKHWFPQTQLTTNMADDDTPSIMQTMDGTIWLAWASTRLDKFDIYYRVDSVLDPHDVAIFSVTHDPDITNIYWDTNITIEVVAQNQGTEAEVGLQVQCYVNSTLIGSQGPFNLAAGQLKALTFTWNTTGFAKDNYIISANVTQVPDETDTLDNTYTDGTIIVTIPGDVNGDGTVDIFDIGTINAHWYPGPPIGPLGYDLNVDINNDGNIDISDIEITSAYWGQSW